MAPLAAPAVAGPRLGDGDLARFLSALDRRLAKEAGGRTGFLGRLSRYLLAGSGKRVRPGLLFLSSRFGDADPEAVMETASAVELIHVATLVHDDLVDEALVRRRRPTVGVRFGEGAAVLLGDHVYAEAFQRLSRLGNARVLGLFAETTRVMCEGEIAQYEHRHRFDLTESTYLTFLQRKTASLMSAACRAGGMLAGLPERSCRALALFGDRIGVAFQIVDDVLDVDGDEAVVGKTLGTDLLNGKMTLPLIYAAASLPTDRARREFRRLLGEPRTRLAEVTRRVRTSGALDRCRERVRGLVAEAEAALAVLPPRPEREQLARAAGRLVDRRA